MIVSSSKDSKFYNSTLFHPNISLLSTYQEEDDFERNRINVALDEIVESWESWTMHSLYYDSPDKDSFSLLIDFNRKRLNNVGLPTMRSMRGVDTEVELR
mgnify:CR=1 FL=1